MKVTTLNLRHDVDRWQERYTLVVNGLYRDLPDIIALQEVALNIGQAHAIAHWLNDKLDECPYRIQVDPKWGSYAKEGLGLLTRFSILEHARLDLPEGGRVAQRVTVQTSNGAIDVYNTHLHHLPQYDEIIRLHQAHCLMTWVDQRSHKGLPSLLLGDLNTPPQSRTVRMIKGRFASAYETVHGHEPNFTFPTPLVEESGNWYKPRTIDYIFFDPLFFQTKDAHLAFAQPADSDLTLYASDHYGLTAVLGQVSA